MTSNSKRFQQTLQEIKTVYQRKEIVQSDAKMYDCEFDTEMNGFTFGITYFKAHSAQIKNFAKDNGFVKCAMKDPDCIGRLTWGVKEHGLYRAGKYKSAYYKLA